MFSMTGYGKAEYVDDDFDLTVEIKTVNNRVFDFNLKSPRVFMPFENEIRKTVSEFVIRGRVDLFVNFSDKREEGNAVVINEEKAVSYYNAGKVLSEKLGIENDLTVSALLRMPEVIEDNGENDISEFKETLIETVKKACFNLNEMRKKEAEKISDDLLTRIDFISAIREKIITRAPLVAKEYKEKLENRVKEALNGVEIDQNALLNEVCIYTDKVNIDEELTRLGSHINQFKEILGQVGAGKKLDFLMQEFNRESNTICSKSNDIEVTKLALSLKNEIEKIREQVQNFE